MNLTKRDFEFLKEINSVCVETMWLAMRSGQATMTSVRRCQLVQSWLCYTQWQYAWAYSQWEKGHATNCRLSGYFYGKSGFVGT